MLHVPGISFQKFKIFAKLVLLSIADWATPFLVPKAQARMAPKMQAGEECMRSNAFQQVHILGVGYRDIQGWLNSSCLDSNSSTCNGMKCFRIHCDNLRHPEETTEPPPGLEFQGACKSTCMVRKDTGQPGSLWFFVYCTCLWTSCKESKFQAQLAAVSQSMVFFLALAQSADQR